MTKDGSKTVGNVVCPECKADNTMFVEGMVEVPLIVKQDGSVWWDWDNAEIPGETIYRCSSCDFSSDHHTADDFYAVGEQA